MDQAAIRVEMLPIDTIMVANPRARNDKIHQEITENIELVGLKRPITVRRMPLANGNQYALICGQGRLESCRMLGQTEIAAIIIETDEETGHMMSLVENIARRRPRASETLEAVGSLRAIGYSDGEIASKIGCSSSWVGMVATLLERGEKRLLAAAEAGHIPLHLALNIARASDEEAQVLLLEAYERGELKGKKISVVRKILEQRIRSGKKGVSSFVRPNAKRSIRPEELTKLFKEDAARHVHIQKKAEHAQNSLLLIQEIFKELFGNKEFCNLLVSEQITTMPQPLAELAHRDILR